MIRIVHLSDLHLSDGYFLPDTAEAVIESVNDITPDILVITGDLTQYGSYNEYRNAEEWIGRIECRNRVIVPGNHDSRNVGYLLFEEIFGKRSSSHSFGRVTVVGVDSSQPDVDDGHVGREMYDWIAECFRPGEIRVFALHHHLLPVPMTGRERQIPVDAGDVLELLCRCDMDLVLCGHKHVPWVWRLNGMLVVNAGTACSKSIKARTTHCYNLIEMEDERLWIYRVFPTGKRELIVDLMNEPES